MATSTLHLDPAFRGDAPIPNVLQTDTPEGGWPRMLNFDEETRERLEQFLDFEIREAWTERGNVVEDWKQWQTDYWAKPAKTVKNFPFRKAANVVIPMTAIAVEAVYARMLTTIFSVKPFYSVRARIPEWVDSAPNVESWFQTEIEDVNSVDMYRFARSSLLELIKHGTGVGKSGYEREIRKVNVDVPGGGVSPKWVTIRDGATLDYVPLANFLMRFSETDPQQAVWVGEEHLNISWAQLKRYGASGRMYKEALEKLKPYFGSFNSIESTAKEMEEHKASLDKMEPTWNDTIDFQEIWLSFDIDGDGYDEEIVIDFHHDSRTILSARYNWYSDLHRPYQIGVYIPVEGRWAGIGVGKQLEQFQALITTIHRQRLDAGTLANMGQIAMKKTSGYGPDEPIWPGKIWFFDNPQTDLQEFSLSNTQHFAQLSNEDAARNYADKRSGANELILGTPTVGTPATATSDLAKLAEGNKKFDMVLKNVRRWYSLLGYDILANYQQFGSRGRSWLVRGEGGEYVERFLQMPQGDVRKGAFLELTVTDSITNKDVEQQKWQNIFVTLSAHYDKLLERAGQVAGLIGDPSVFIMFAEMALKSSNEAMSRYLGAAGVPDVNAFLIDLDKLGGTGEPGQAQGGASGPGQGGNGSSQQARGNGSLPVAGGQSFAGLIGDGVSVESQ